MCAFLGSEDKAVHPGLERLNPNEKSSQKCSIGVRQQAALQIRWDCAHADLLFQPKRVHTQREIKSTQAYIL